MFLEFVGKGDGLVEGFQKRSGGELQRVIKAANAVILRERIVLVRKLNSLCVVVRSIVAIERENLVLESKAFEHCLES